MNDEYQYLNLIEEIIRTGSKRNSRNSKTLSIFGTKMTYSLKNNTLPLLTTKKMFWKGIVEELIWFISGSTDSTMLSRKKVNIWKPNSSQQYLKQIGLHNYKVGEVGPIYGFQWRHFGAKYRGIDASYENQGIDQLKQVIENMKKDPFSRRHVVSAWNPIQLKEMVLPPCHILFQFYVHADPQTNKPTELSCQLYQRSGDVGLGIPFNIASYSLLTHLVANHLNLKAREFIHVIGDTHIYKSHINPLQHQSKMKVCHKFPTIEFDSNIDIFNLKYEDIKLNNYKWAKHIKLEMIA